ncbi:MAG: BrnT family toxin [Spirochaetaceae bacterium]|nr:BrnT family toxin [Spirochaetaceae bacterium]
MEFEFDPKKSMSNKHKHGIDFVEGQTLWDDPERLELPARTVGEQRYMLIGKIGDKHWSAVFTTRGESTRVVSVRRARTEEIDAYEN